MEISLISDTIPTLASQALGFSNLNFATINSHLSLTDQLMSTGQPSPHISTAIFLLDAVEPPTVRPNNHVKTLPRRLIQKRRRVKRKSRKGGDDSEDIWTYGDRGDFNDTYFNYYSGGFFGGHSGGGGWGRGGGGGDKNMGWNFNWDESASNSYPDPAFDFVYEVLSWIVLSNCLHFAFKKVIRIVADGFGETSREKVPIRLTTMC